MPVTSAGMAIASRLHHAAGRTAVSGGGYGTVRVWDLAGTAAPRILTGHDGQVVGVAVSADGRTAVVPRRAGWARPRHAGWARRVTGKAPPIASAGPGGARVAAAVTGLSWSAVRAGDGGGDPGDVGVIEAAQDAGEVDGDVVVAEAGGDSEDGSFGGRAAELVAVQGGDWRVPSRCRRRDARRGGCRRGCSWC